MIGFLLLYFIAKPFYQLAEEHEKNKWLYAIMAIAVYYIGVMAGGLMLGICFAIFKGDEGVAMIESANQTLLGLACIPFGLLLVWGVYVLLKKHLEGKYSKDTDDNLDILDSNL